METLLALSIAFREHSHSLEYLHRGHLIQGVATAITAFGRPLGEVVQKGALKDTVAAKRVSLFVLAAWVLHLVSWFLTVVKAQDIRGAIVGWKAFRLAACGVWPCEGVEFQEVVYAVLATISVITTLFFILCAPGVVLWGSRTVQKSLAWFAAVSFVFNAHWIVIFGTQRSLLSIGYYFWWLSFLLLAIGLFRIPKTRVKGASAQPSFA